MPIDLGTMRFAVLVADADTPAELRAFVGRPVPIPDGVELPSTLDSITFNGQTWWGYARWNSANGVTEWVMAPPIDPTAVMLDSLPGPNGWINQQARQSIRQVGIAVRKAGLSGPELRPAFQKVWAAIVAERDAQILAGGGRIGPEPPQ
jgi:hypothetical protein